VAHSRVGSSESEQDSQVIPGSGAVALALIDAGAQIVMSSVIKKTRQTARLRTEWLLFTTLRRLQVKSSVQDCHIAQP
jgi:hypothetical protein